MAENSYEPPYGKQNSAHDELLAYLSARERWSAALEPYNEPLRRRSSDTPCTEEEEHFIHGYVFWTAMIEEGEIFGKMDDAPLFRPHLEAIGAKGSLAAIEALSPSDQQYRQAIDPSKFLDEHRAEIRRAESLAESLSDFACLLLRYAQSHLQPEAR